MTNEDVLMIKQYFLNKTGRDTISKQEWIKLMETEFERRIDKIHATKSLYDVKVNATK